MRSTIFFRLREILMCVFSVQSCMRRLCKELTSLFICARTLLNDCNHSETAIFWRSAIEWDTVHSRYNVHPDLHKSARLKFKVACIRFAEKI